MKESNLHYGYLLLALLIKFFVSLLVVLPIYSLLYVLISGVISVILLKYKIKTYNYLLFIIGDFLVSFILTINMFGINFSAIIFSIIYFVLSSSFLFILLGINLTNKTTYRSLNFICNLEIDKGIQALNNNDLDKASDYFLKAIRENKENYLGYMGMCTTLSKADKKNLKKLKYYKKKCIKYAPEELKHNIDERY